MRSVKRMYRRALLRLDGNSFAFFFNLRAVITSSPSRLSWDGERFIVSDKNLPGFSKRIRHQRQCNMAYEFGIEHRAESLATCYFLDQIDFKRGDIVLDCGANVGDLKTWFDLNEKEVEYIGFEPSPVEYSCLKENVKPSAVHNIGLWNDVGELEFFLSSQGADSSLIQPPEYEEIIKVPVAKLKDFVASPVKLLKLEAEGAEPEILEGLEERLNFIEYISADLGFERGVKCESTLVPVTNYLLNRDFELLNFSGGRISALYRNKSIVK